MVNQARIRVIKRRGLIAFHAATVDIDTVPQDWWLYADNPVRPLAPFDVFMPWQFEENGGEWLPGANGMVS